YLPPHGDRRVDQQVGRLRRERGGLVVVAVGQLDLVATTIVVAAVGQVAGASVGVGERDGAGTERFLGPQARGGERLARQRHEHHVTQAQGGDVVRQRLRRGGTRPALRPVGLDGEPAGGTRIGRARRGDPELGGLLGQLR